MSFFDAQQQPHTETPNNMPAVDITLLLFTFKTYADKGQMFFS